MKEFKKFISKGNALDLAVGVIMGSAFGKIVTSIVENILTPLIGLLVGGTNLSNLSIKIADAEISYGVFLQNVIDFLIVAFCLFIIVKAVNKITNKKEKKEEIKKKDEVLLLEEIRDLLKKETK